MSPEIVVAAVSASCAVLLVVGSLLVGSAMADRSSRKKRGELQASLAALREQLKEASTKADAARAEAEALKLESEEKLSEVLGQEMAKSDREVEELKEQLADSEAKLKKAKAAASEADKEFTILRDKLDKTEKRLAQLERTANESDNKDDSLQTKLDKVEAELSEAKQAATKLTVVERERDAAKKRVAELEKKNSDGLLDLQRKLDDALAEGKRLASEIEARDERIKAMSSSTAPVNAEQLQQELAAANERVAVSERVMEGVRARSKMLSEELKRVKAELAELRKD